ncbi:MAG: ABC transporter permease [Propionibacteriaceae bacterium]|nr:ABC transporter permease [Propionibacteriaceae bacterium]
MLAAFFYRYWRVLLRSPADTIAMFIRPLLSGLLLLVFAHTLSGFQSLGGFMIVSAMTANVITNTVLGAAYESLMDLQDSKRELIELAPGGLRSYSLVQALTQGGIATLQSALVGAVLLPWTNDKLRLDLVFCVASLLLGITVVAVAACTCQHSVVRGSYLGVSFAIGIVLAFSGIFYPVNMLPLWARLVSSANPVTYLVGGIRSGFGALDTSRWPGLLYAGAWAGVSVVLFLRASCGHDLHSDHLRST